MIELADVVLARLGYALCGVGFVLGLVMIGGDRPLDLQGTALIALSLLGAILIHLLVRVLESVAQARQRLLDRRG